ncbi:MAG: rhomboid family protein [Phenylobacterium sp.]|nr:rhomboid family protein [Phenylobacterium sp.]
MEAMTISPFEDSPPSPWSGEPQPQPQPDERPAHEPAFNAPWTAVAISAVIVLGYAIQSILPQDAVLEAFAFSPKGLAQGQWPTLITALFLHGGWPHALMNAAFALAFGTPVARFFGLKLQGAIAFFAFYLATGVLSNLGYAALHWGQAGALVGASGAVSGLMGAAARLIGGRGRIGPLFSPAVVGMGASWIAINVAIGIFGSSLLPGTGGAGVAWEAHLAGFAAGVLIITPFAWLAPKD